MQLNDKQILVGVTGGIAAYKCPSIVRLLVKAGASVRVVMTEKAEHFVTPLTLQVVSEHPVGRNVNWMDEKSSITHISWAEEADLMLIAPCTANVLAKAAHGLADDLLTSLLLAVTCPVVLAPAMHHQMWANRVVQDNVARLKVLGFTIIEPAEGPLASGDIGLGRMPEPEQILAALESL